MTWNTAPEYELTPEDRAIYLHQRFGIIEGEVIQKMIIKKLENHGIHSEYENQVLIEIEKL